MSKQTFEEELNRISGDIDQVTVQKIFRKLATGKKKHDDELWALTSEAARDIRKLVKGDILAAHHQHTQDRVVEVLEDLSGWVDRLHVQPESQDRWSVAAAEIKMQIDSTINQVKGGKL